MATALCACAALLLAGGAGGVPASAQVAVVQLQLAYNEVHALQLNNTVEYILEFTPPAGGVGSYDSMPSLVWLHSDGGDIAHPVLVTARQRAGKRSEVLTRTGVGSYDSMPSLVWLHSDGGNIAHPVLVTARQRAGKRSEVLTRTGVGSYDSMPSLVWLHSDGGDIAHPVLVTARQRAGKRSEVLTRTGVGSYDSMPSLVWLHSDGGDIAHPVLVTARQRAGKRSEVLTRTGVGSYDSMPSLVWLHSDGGDIAHPVLVTARQRAGKRSEVLTRTGVGSYDSMPSLVWLHSDGGDIAHPVLVTARQRAGAVTWQLPYELQERHLFELERTLCPDDTAEAGDATLDCEGAAARGAFSVHVSTACAAPLLVRLRVSRPAVWRLPFGSAVDVNATESAPRVSHYAFEGDQHSVRLVVSSENSACAMLSVQNYSCPIAQTLTGVETGGQRLTMIHSGAVQVMRSQFPRGFFVVTLVFPTDAPCRAAAPHDNDWLWGGAVLRRDEPPPVAPSRNKDFTIAIGPALTREQYAWASVATLAVFLVFYVLFGALVLAQRWPPFARLVRPKAVLAPSPLANASGVEQATSPRRGRRGSNDTYDSCDDSNSDVEPDAAPPRGQPAPARRAGNGALADRQDAPPQQNDSQGPFGVPARLQLAELARRPTRTLRARSDRYLHTLYTVAVFYALPVVQFVIAFQVFLNVSGSLDYCYYNFLCAHRAGALSDFNHVISNLGYLLLGALFMLQVRRRRLRRKREPRHQEYGIPAHYGLLSALGAGMMVVAVLSASYHVCPNRLNFQFDTAFMYVLAVLIMVKIYQTRHPDINARAHATFGVLAVLIATVVWGVLGGGRVFWGVFTAAHVFTFLLLSLHIYYFGQFRFEKEILAQAASELRKSARPLHRARLAMLALGNVLNWMLAIYGVLQQSGDFAGHMLVVLLGNAMLYMVFYLGMKLAHGERLRWYAWALLAGATAAWAPALYFFLSGSSDWSATPALSRHRNHECKVMQFYDNHDLWHMLSAVALYLSFSALLTWDDGLSAVKRTEIPVF